MRLRPLSLLLALIIGAPTAGAAQRPGRGAGAPATPADSAMLERMKAALRQTVMLEERYFAQHRRYTNDRKALDALDDRKLPRWPRPPQVQVLVARSRGWTGEVRHPSLPGRSCVIWVGNRAALPHLPRTTRDKAVGEEGEPACDRL